MPGKLIAVLVAVALVLVIWFVRGDRVDGDASTAAPVLPTQRQSDAASAAAGSDDTGMHPNVDRYGVSASQSSSPEQVEQINGAAAGEIGSLPAEARMPHDTRNTPAYPPGSPEASGAGASNLIAPENWPGASDLPSMGQAPEASDAGIMGLPPEADSLIMESVAPEAGQPSTPGLAPEASDPGITGPAPEDSGPD